MVLRGKIAPGFGSEGYGQGSLDGADGSGQGQLTDEEVVVEQAGEHLVGGTKHAYGDGQVEARAFLADVGGGEVDGDAAIGVAIAGVQDRSANPVSRFLDGSIGQPDYNGSRVSCSGIYLHFKGMGLDPE
jgi:hypothetical protein